MEKKYAKLFESVNIGSVRLKNRISMAPMGLVGYSDFQGGFTERAQDYYIERAKGGTGLIITGICAVDYNEIEDFGLPCPSYNPILFRMSTAPMIEKIHSYDAKIFLQLTGGLGRSAVPGLFKKAIGPSENVNRFDSRILHREMTGEEIETLIGNFVKSAVSTKKAGFDGIEIHAVHEGYLLDQFAIAFFNRRTDAYGGDLRGRLKITTDIVQEIKKACGADFPVSLRFSLKSMMKGLRQGALPGEVFSEVGKDYEEGLESARILEKAGYDALNVDAGTYDSWYWNHPPMYFEKGMYRSFGRMVKEAVNIPVIVAGRLDDPDLAMDALDGCCDIVSYGRPLLADPFLPQKLQTEQYEEIRPCLSCHDGCMGRIAQGLPLSCAVNPACGRERIYGIETAVIKKKILVIGGGVAGMECARVCALRGHRVSLWEKGPRLGGNLIPAGAPEFKEDERQLLKWYELQLKKLGVGLMLNCAVGVEEVRNSDVDIAVVAAGSHPVKPELGIKNHICMAADVLGGKTKAGDRIIVAGGGLMGCETALWLARQGKIVSIVEMSPNIMGGPSAMPFMNYDMLKDLLAYHNVKIYRSTRLEAVEDSEVILESPDGELKLPADTVIIAMGYRPDTGLYEGLRQTSKEIYCIGDAREVRNIMSAVWSAYEVARGL